MELTEIKVFPVSEEKLKAYVTIVLDNCFVVRDLKIISGNSGLFVAMPSKKRKDGSYKDVAHPLNQETRTLIEEKILKRYLETIKGEGEEGEDGGGDSGDEAPTEPAADSGEAPSESSDSGDSGEEGSSS